MKTSNEFTYPPEPPRPIPKPEFKRGQKKEERPKPPKESLWGFHDPAIYKDPVTHMYYIYCTGGVCSRSADLISWERIGKVVSEPPKESSDWVGSKDIWAPDIVKVGKEYRLYCSNSTWGVRQSCIFLAAADNPEGPFLPRGCVIKTAEPTSPCNAIDANIISDEETGDMYLLYGSFWDGCHMIRLDKKTGLAAEDGFGICVARRPGFMDHAIEGPYIRYNPDTGYYYLFVSYASLKNDYNIRVGRSRCVTGPYVDHNGRLMTDGKDDDNTIGYMIACGYQFDHSKGFMGPGHNSVLRDDDGRWYLVCHVREHDFRRPGISTMHCRQMFWTEDGWPLISPEIYSGEFQGKVTRNMLIGHYERIKLTPMLPQGVLNSVPLFLKKDGSFELCSIQGHWKLTDDTTLVMTYGPYTETCQVAPAWDYENWCPTVIFTGKDQNSICVWGKKITLDFPEK